MFRSKTFISNDCSQPPRASPNSRSLSIPVYRRSQNMVETLPILNICTKGLKCVSAEERNKICEVSKY